MPLILVFKPFQANSVLKSSESNQELVNARFWLYEKEAIEPQPRLQKVYNL